MQADCVYSACRQDNAFDLKQFETYMYKNRLIYANLKTNLKLSLEK